MDNSRFLPLLTDLVWLDAKGSFFGSEKTTNANMKVKIIVLNNKGLVSEITSWVFYLVTWILVCCN